MLLVLPTATGATEYHLTEDYLSSIIETVKAYLNASEIAKFLKVNRATIARWAKKGIFRGAIQVKGTHQWRIPLAAYEEVVRQKTKNEGR